MNLAKVESTIENLRNISTLQGSVINSLEAYERIVAGSRDSEGVAFGYCNGYAVELQYLKHRRAALDQAIVLVQRYAQSTQSTAHLAAPISVG